MTFNPRVDGVVDKFIVDSVERDGPDGTERVTVLAQVRGADGRVTPRTLLFTLQRQDGRWFITALARRP